MFSEKKKKKKKNAVVSNLLAGQISYSAELSMKNVL